MILASVVFLVLLIIKNKEGSINRMYFYVCVCVGLVSGLLIGLSTDFYTSKAHGPV